MRLKVIIIGKNSFVGANLYYYLKKKMKVSIISFNDFMKKKKLSNIDYVINCSLTPDYLIKKYKSDYDIDYLILNKIKKFEFIKYIFLSSRKIYKPKANIFENSAFLLNDNYSRNKFKTEKILSQNLKNRLLTLRVSNLIGLRKNKKNRKIHKTFIDYFIEASKKQIIYDNKNVFKDFLPINIFCKIVFLLIKKNKSGIYNVSIGKKIYLNNVIKWLNYYNPNKNKIMELSTVNIKKFDRSSFFLNNKKLRKAINLKINLIELKNKCLEISKNIFYEKN